MTINFETIEKQLKLCDFHHEVLEDEAAINLREK
jgi:hypothetical protein